MSGTNHEAPHCAIFAGILLLPPSYAQIYFSAPSSRTPALILKNILLILRTAGSDRPHLRYALRLITPRLKIYGF